MAGLFDKLKNRVNESSPELLSKAASMLDKAKKAADELNVKAQPHLDKAKQETDEFIIKAVPILKEATENAKKNTAILKEQTLKKLDEEKQRRQQLKLQAEQDAQARLQRLDSMYDTLLTSESEDYISERFIHYDRFLNFMAITGQVLKTEKRSEFNIDARFSSYVGYSSFSYRGTGYSAMRISNSFHLSAKTTTAHEFWLKLADGTEAPFYIGDSAVPLREGQTITLIFASDNDDVGSLILVHNHNADAVWQVMTPIQLAHWSSLYKIEPGFFVADKKADQNERVLKALVNKFEELKKWTVTFNTAGNEKLIT